MGFIIIIKKLFGKANIDINSWIVKTEGFADDTIAKGKEMAPELVRKVGDSADIAKEKIGALVSGAGDAIEHSTNIVKEKPSLYTDKAVNFVEISIQNCKKS